MKKLFFAFAALLVFAACQKELPIVSIYSDVEFNANNIATATVKLSAASDSDVQVLLEGTPADKLTFSNRVTIPAGNLSADFMVKVNPDGIDPEAPIQVFIKDAIGANVGAPAMVTIGLKTYGNESGGEGEGGNGGEGGEGGDGSLTLVSTWKAEMDGDPYTDEDGDWIDLTMTTPGIGYYVVDGLTDATFANYFSSVEDFVQEYEASVADYLQNGYTVADLLFANGEYTYIEYPGAGAGKIYIIEFDANGKATGRYGVTAVTFPEFEGGNGGGSDITATLVSTWKAEMDGDPYTDEYGDWIDLKMTTTGIKYYAVEGVTDDMFDYFYEGIEDLIQSYDDYIATCLEDGYSVSDLLFVDGEYTYIEYPGEGAGKIYIVEFDASGKATGRYGVTAATFPEFEGGSGGGGDLDWEKTTVGVPATFTKNTSLGVEYQGRYTYTDEEETISLDVFSATGTGESLWAIDVFAPNAFDGDVHAYAADIAASLEYTLAEYIEDYGADLVSYFYEDLADFLAQECLGTYEGEGFAFDTYENGTYDAIVLTFTADGDFSGQYNLVKVTVDGHEYQEAADSQAQGAPARIAGARRHHFPIGKGLENVIPARSRHASHTKVAARRLAPSQAKRHSVISSVAEKSVKKLNKICRLK